MAVHGGRRADWRLIAASDRHGLLQLRHPLRVREPGDHPHPARAWGRQLRPGPGSCPPPPSRFLLSRCGRSLPANASGFDPHRASIRGRFVQMCGAGTCVRVLVPACALLYSLERSQLGLAVHWYPLLACSAAELSLLVCRPPVSPFSEIKWGALGIRVVPGGDRRAGQRLPGASVSSHHGRLQIRCQLLAQQRAIGRQLSPLAVLSRKQGGADTVLVCAVGGATQRGRIGDPVDVANTCLCVITIVASALGRLRFAYVVRCRGSHDKHRR
jgi:hypothetical protein